MSSIKRIFLNVSMVNRIDGLRKIAKDAGVKLSEMQPGDYLFYVNGDRNKIAALVGSQNDKSSAIMAYSKLSSGQKLNMMAIRNIPRFFDGRQLNYDKALEAAVDQALKDKARKRTEMF